MAKKKTNLKKKQIENQKKNKEARELLKQKEEEKKVQAEKKKKIIKFTALILACVLLCGAFVVGISSYFINKTKQQHKLFVYGLVAVQNDNGKWGYINTSGNSSIDFVYDNAFNFTKNKRALVSQNGKYGFINTKGEVVIQMIYDEAISFDGDVAVCKKDDVYGTIDSKGNTVTEFKYLSIGKYNGKYAIACDKNNKYGVIDRAGNVVVNFEYSLINQVNDIYFRYEKSKIGYVEFIDSSKTLEGVFESEFQESNLLDNGYFIYRIAGNYGLVNRKGEIIISHKKLKDKFICKSLKYTSGDFLIYSTSGDLYGYLDFDGKVVYEDKFSKASNFDGYAVVKMKDAKEFSVIDRSGKLKFSLECDDIRDFKNGRAIFKKGGKYGVVNVDGKVIVDPEYKYISDFYDDDYAVFCSEKNLYGIINTKGKIIIKDEFKNFVII